MNRAIALFLSFVGNPIFVLTYVLLIMLAANPYAFGIRSMDDHKAIVLILSVFSTTVLIPGVGVAAMVPLGLIKTIKMGDKQDRTGPYIIGGIFYLWLFKNLVTGGIAPLLYTKFVLGATISLFLDFFINIFFKVSAHATGMGGMVAMILLTALNWSDSALGIPLFGGTLQLTLFALLAVVLVFAGLVGTSRLALAAHTPQQLYAGYAVGFSSVFIGYWML